MAYNFFAENRGKLDLKVLHEQLSRFKLIEFFPVYISEDSFMLGISIPFKVVESLEFEDELETAMRYLVSEQDFQVTDLFTGDALTSENISGLANRILA
jgi:hypothetical protein